MSKEVTFTVYHKCMPYDNGSGGYGEFSINVDDNTTYADIKAECAKTIKDDSEGEMDAWYNYFSTEIKERELNPSSPDSYQTVWSDYLKKSNGPNGQKYRGMNLGKQLKDLCDDIVNFKSNPNNFIISSVCIVNGTTKKLNTPLKDTDKIKEKFGIKNNTKEVLLFVSYK